MVVGITGKSGCGKSTISGHIRDLGYKVIDVDIIHKAVSANCMDKIYEIYKDMGYDELTHRDKVKLFFEDINVRERVNEVTFKETVSKILQEIQQCGDDDIIFLDAPLLFDMKLNLNCDKIWCAYCGKEINIQRLMARNNLSYAEALNRYNALDFSRYRRMFNLFISTEYDYLRLLKQRISKYEENNGIR